MHGAEIGSKNETICMRSQNEQKQGRERERERGCMQVQHYGDLFPYIMRSEPAVESLKLDALPFEGLELLNELFAGGGRVLLTCIDNKRKVEIRMDCLFES